MRPADPPEQSATAEPPPTLPAPKVIQIRKLDKIETTSPSFSNGN